MKMIKSVVLAGLFFLIFFTYIPYLPFLNACSWRVVCPDYGSQINLISWVPNFYVPKACGGWGVCIEAHWSLGILATDLIVFGILFLLIKKLWQK